LYLDSATIDACLLFAGGNIRYPESFYSFPQFWRELSGAVPSLDQEYHIKFFPHSLFVGQINKAL
jgi:hypothetical protein